MSVQWVDDLPPARGSKAAGAPRVWEPLLAPLSERPGTWALVKHFDTATGAKNARKNLGRGRGAGIDASRYQFATREDGEGGSDLFVRFVGGPM